MKPLTDRDIHVYETLAGGSQRFRAYVKTSAMVGRLIEAWGHTEFDALYNLKRRIVEEKLPFDFSE